MENNEKKMKYEGMTVNERLFLSGLMDEYDLARERNDNCELLEILRRVDIDDVSIKQILEGFQAKS